MCKEERDGARLPCSYRALAFEEGNVLGWPDHVWVVACPWIAMKEPFAGRSCIGHAGTWLQAHAKAGSWVREGAAFMV